MSEIKNFDAAEYLDSPEMVAEYITEVLATDDPDLIAKAIGAVARAQGMTQVAKAAGVSRENLYRALDGDTKPEFGTIMKVLRALNIQLSAQPKTPVPA